MDSDFKVAVIGLGLIGGSMAYALKGFRKAEIVGCDTDAETRSLAVKNKAVSRVFDNPGDAIDGSDVVIFCTYPDSIGGLIDDNRLRFKKGAVISDVCGVKRTVAAEIKRILPDGVDYVGGHPMAGKEVEGFKNASPELFWMCGYIVTPTETSKPESVKLIREIAHYIGATRITEASPEEHDRVIAYTSDLMHISASALCLTYPEEMNRAYTAGAFRDCTRVARINPGLWSELFLSNRENVVSEAERLIKNITEIKNAVESGDKAEIERLLSTVCENKITMQNKEPT